MPTNAGWVVPRHAYYADRISIVVQRLVESGIIDKYRKNVMDNHRLLRARETEETMDDEQETDGQLRNLTMSHMSWVFVMAGLGFSIALFVFFLEFVYSARIHRGV
jgi:hypothetical protein